MMKIENEKLLLYKKAFSTDSLLVAFYQITSNFGNMRPSYNSKILKGIIK